MDKNRRLKKILREIRIARSSDYTTYHVVMSGSIMNRIIKTLEEISDWDEKDEEKLNVILQKIKESTQQKMTLKEKYEIIKNIIEEK